MEGILDSYYSVHEAGDHVLSRGSLALAPSAFLLEEFWEIELSNSNPAVEWGKGFITLRQHTPAECHDPASGVFRHNPIHPIHLRANEAWAGIEACDHSLCWGRACRSW